MDTRYTKEALTEYFYEALSMFNDALDTDITPETIVLDFYMPDTGLAVYKRFCERYFPDKYETQHEATGYFESIAAEAFVGDKQYGVLIRSDIDFTLGELLMTFLHEISHLFCVKNEIAGGNFFDTYCQGSGQEDGIFNAGYAVWREAVADIMADSIMSEYSTLTLGMAAPEIKRHYNQIDHQNPGSKKCLSLIIAYTMIAREVSTTEKWETAKIAIKGKTGINDTVLLRILELVFAKLHQSPFWVITPEFIYELGFLYVELLTFRTFSLHMQDQR